MEREKIDIALILHESLDDQDMDFKKKHFPFKLYHNNNKRTIGNIAHLRKVPTNKHICTKLWLYHNIDQESNT